MTDVCSAWAYHDILQSGYLGERQSMYLAVFAESPDPLTAWEATQEIEARFGKGFSKNGIGSRLSELVDMGFLSKHDKVHCPNTQQTVNRWRYTGTKRPKTKRWVSRACPHCNGSGAQTKEEYGP